jgi:hypothetical protein
VRRRIDGLIQVRLGRRPLFAFDLVLILAFFIVVQASIVVAYADFWFAAGLLLLVALARASLRSLLAVFAFAAILPSIEVPCQNPSSRASIFFVVFVDDAVLSVEGGWDGGRGGENLRGSALADETAPERGGRGAGRGHEETRAASPKQGRRRFRVWWPYHRWRRIFGLHPPPTSFLTARNISPIYFQLLGLNTNYYFNYYIVPLREGGQVPWSLFAVTAFSSSSSLAHKVLARETLAPFCSSVDHGPGDVRQKK